MRHTDVVITGFVKSPLLAAMSLGPLIALQQEGVVRDIHYVTWDSPELDEHVMPFAAIPEVRLTRVPQPDAAGNPNQRGIVYQVENLKAGLAQLRDTDGLVFKTRLDFIADADFLRDKITGFDTHCALPDRRAPNGVVMPEPVFEKKIWIPWADSNQPFFYEDAVFLGTCRDISRLVTPLFAADFAVLADLDCGPYAHVMRFARIFAPRCPMLDGYLRHYRGFVNDLDYRMKLVRLLLEDGFFWHLLVAHAWILYSQFHVDIGQPGDLLFYPNNINRNAEWSKPQSLNLANPYDDILGWRRDTHPGHATVSVGRAYGRLMDDAWQTALFEGPLPDFSADILRSLMENVAGHADGRLKEIEQAFYARLERFRQTGWPQAKAS